MKHNCTLCKSVCNTLKDYNEHLDGGRHTKALNQLRKAQGKEPPKIDPSRIR